MVESFHYIVDNAEGVFLAFAGQMQIDHGGFQLGVPQVALDSADINACFKEMRLEGVKSALDSCSLIV